jgi:hypothetical protein
LLREARTVAKGLFVKHEGSPYLQGRANTKSRRKLLDPTTTAKTYARVDVSKDQLDVYVRHGEAGRNRRGAAFAVPHDDAGIDALVSRLAEERPVLVILEATGGLSGERWLGLWPLQDCR